MEDEISRVIQEMIDRTSGPMKFRFFLQPAIACCFGIRDGYKDALSGSRPYLWLISTDPSQRVALVRDGWRSIAKVFVLALLLDFIYQFLVLSAFYPIEAFATALLLAFFPYAVIRGLANRITILFRRHD